MVNIIIGIIFGILITLIIFYPKYKKKVQLDEDKVKQNIKLIKEIDIKQNELNTLDLLNSEKEKRNQDLQKRIVDATQQLTQIDNQAAEAAENYKKIHIDKAEAEIKLKEKNLDLEFQNYKKFINESKDEAIKEYLITLSDLVKYYQDKITKYSVSTAEAAKKLTELQSKVDAAVAANKRQFEEENQKDFYRLIITEEDLKEISKIREIIPYLRNPEPLNKVIYKYYYEKPYNDLIGRVLGSKIHTGIYKITNLNNGLCYVGQAVNVADRWRQHIKRGLGAETPTQNKLYPAMLKEGVENFSFELIEDCDRIKLNEREDYWQEYFKAKEFGYSIK